MSIRRLFGLLSFFTLAAAISLKAETTAAIPDFSG
jgi:hypothetical protein